ncbi:SpoIIE family protein phosphatase [Actinomadura hibisca]|uniref:SpoIIE family protein phosphatase n=1 Tax=Actinomadura hibisca TaxID=68565 RepID=UPI00082F0EB7|nr:SpoIIE family protein phosphatase [Actinomadura hibisca]
MPEQLEPETIMREITDLEGRIGELRQAADLPQPDLRATLDAALLELELALTALRAMGAEQGGAAGAGAAAETERRVLRTVFQDAPVPLFLLDRDNSVRRANRQAAGLLGTSSGYVSGKQFTAFCDLATRAALRSQLAAVVRTGRRLRVPVRFLGREHPVDAVVTLARVWIRGEPDPMVIAAAGPTTTPTDDPAAPAPAVKAEPADDEAVATIVHRMDVLATASELLLDEPVFNETVAVRRCARLLAAELADWAFIDLTGVESGPAVGGPSQQAERRLNSADPPRRQVVMGPADDERAHEAARMLEELDPAPDTLPHTVWRTRQSALRPHLEDLNQLGTGPDGQPVCAKIGATSVLCVPVEDGDRCIGTITLASRGEHGPFDLTDLGVVQRLGRYLALVIRAARLYRRRAEVADSLQASLLPKTLPAIPGVELDARYMAASHGGEVGGDFYDVFRTPGGWGLVLGDVCGKGEDAAAVTATARHGVRLVSRWKSDPTEVLAMVNETLLEEDRFVTAVLAALTPTESGVTAALGLAGHPPAVVVRGDGVIRSASRGGVPLGLFEDFEAGLDTIELVPGDTLFLHSDGVLEACDLMRQEFGQERLLDTLAAHAAGSVQSMLDAVQRTLLEYCDGDLRDDVSMLALRVLPPTLG